MTRQVYRDLRNRRKFFEPMPAWLIKARISGRIWNAYFKFAVERNPWDKVISRLDHWNKVNKTGRTVTLDQFLDWLTPELKDPWNSPAPYNYPRYHDPGRNTLMVDHVCRYENLHQELKWVFNQLRIPFEETLQIKAKSQYREDRRPYSEALTNEQIGRIGELFRKEIAFMQYLPEPAITSPVS